MLAINAAESPITAILFFFSASSGLRGLALRKINALHALKTNDNYNNIHKYLAY